MKTILCMVLAAWFGAVQVVGQTNAPAKPATGEKYTVAEACVAGFIIGIGVIWYIDLMCYIKDWPPPDPPDLPPIDGPLPPVVNPSNPILNIPPGIGTWPPVLNGMQAHPQARGHDMTGSGLMDTNGPSASPWHTMVCTRFWHGDSPDKMRPLYNIMWLVSTNGKLMIVSDTNHVPLSADYAPVRNGQHTHNYGKLDIGNGTEKTGCFRIEP